MHRGNKPVNQRASFVICYRSMSLLTKSIENLAQVTIVGVGLLGGSIGLALKAAGYRGRVIGVGRRPQVVERAIELKCIDAGCATLSEAVAMVEDKAAAQLVIICTPLSTFSALFAEFATCDRPGLIITDAGSTKEQVCKEAKAILPDASRFVGAHPMAGSELHGPEHAKADLFKGRLCILTPQGTSSRADAVELVRDLWQALGMKLTEKSPHDHDQIVAAISHLPHAIAANTSRRADEQKAISIAATGFRDTTRIASGDPRVWTDIFTSNKQAMLESLDHFSQSLARFREVVSSGDEAEMLRLLSDVKQARDTWLKQTWGE